MATRIPHVEPRFHDEEFVADYSKAMKRYAGADSEPILQFAIAGLEKFSAPKVLEIGPGPGWIGISLAKRRPDLELVGIDISESYVQIATKNAQEEEVGDRVQFQVRSASDLATYPDQSYHAVVSNQSFHYWDEPERVLDEIARILKPGGVVSIGADRRDLTLLANIAVTLTKWILKAEVRDSWMQSFQGSFTTDEVREILNRSALSKHASLKVCSRMYFIEVQMPV